MKLGPVEIRRPGRRRVTDDWEQVTDLNQFIDTHDIVEITESGSIIAVQRPKQLADPSLVDFRELGTTGITSWGRFLRDEYNPEFKGLSGLMKYDRMRRSDAMVRATLRLAKTPILAAEWYMEPASRTNRTDQRVADFVWNNLTKWMSVSWPQLLIEILSFLDFGWYSAEKVFTIRDGKTIWQKLACRHPMDLYEWQYDANGGPNRAIFYGPLATYGVPIDINKLLVWTYDKEGGDMCGISLLRSAYKHWYFKDNMYKIDAIQKERHGIGIPIVKLPPNFQPQDRKLADELGRNLRTNEKAHITIPPNWEVAFADLQGNPVDANVSIEHHNRQLAVNILATFMVDSGSVSESDRQEMFMKASRFIADIVTDVFNKWAIPELVNYNWLTVDDYPRLRARRIGDAVDWRTISFAIRNLVGAGVIVPDEPLEEWARESMYLPMPDPETKRQVATPQLPSGGGQAGLPRQSQAANMDKTPGNNGRVGVDKSGGN